MDLRDPRFSFENNLSPVGSHAKRPKNVDENLFFGTAFICSATLIPKNRSGSENLRLRSDEIEMPE